MKNDVFHLPDHFTGGQNPDVYFHFYSNHRSSARNKIVYSQNLLLLLQRGTKEVFNSSDHIKIDNSHVVLLASGSVLMSERVPEYRASRSILIFFSNEFLRAFFLKHGLQESGAAAESNMLMLAKDDFIRNYETSLQLLEPLNDAHLQKVKLEEMLLYLVRKHPAELQSFIRQALQNNVQQKIKDAVLSGMDRNLTIDELAFLCNMSASTFKRHFAELFHTSPKKYFTEKRMQRAKQLLQMKKRVSEIYLELGYENLSSFSSEFKKHFGMSPKQFQSENELKAKVFEPSA
ncbi:MAG TPA: AraC family transcriptional regulator [Flavisolibacter sp.]|jgi:AraC-like DNA-binding protein